MTAGKLNSLSRVYLLRMFPVFV